MSDRLGSIDFRDFRDVAGVDVVFNGVATADECGRTCGELENVCTVEIGVGVFGFLHGLHVASYLHSNRKKNVNN